MCVSVSQNCPVFCPNSASEWIEGQFQHVEEKNLPNLAVAKTTSPFSVLLSLFTAFFSFGEAAGMADVSSCQQRARASWKKCVVLDCLR